MSDMKFMGLKVDGVDASADHIYAKELRARALATVSPSAPLGELIFAIQRVQQAHPGEELGLLLTPARIAEINEAFTLVAPVEPVSWTVKLTYFKPSGKYYTHGEYRTNKANMFEIADEVQCLIERGALPGLAAGHQEYYHVLIDAGDHPNAYPVLVPSREVSE